EDRPSGKEKDDGRISTIGYSNVLDVTRHRWETDATGTGMQDRTVAGEIFAAWQVQLARARWLGLPAPTPQHTVQELLTEYRAKVTPRKSPASQRRDHVVLERFRKRWGTLGLDQLHNKTVDDYLTERLHDVTLATVSKELGILKSADARAMRWDGCRPRLSAASRSIRRARNGCAGSPITKKGDWWPPPRPGCVISS
ncbi:MAG TPA: hypothetical protein VK901_12985, partial [Nitrospiraceae bacterium]|nr:hypothetical protein [Nitrospiraceae bacterium]